MGIEFKDKIVFHYNEEFECLSHNLLIAKLNPYGFDNKGVRFVYD